MAIVSAASFTADRRAGVPRAGAGEAGDSAPHATGVGPGSTRRVLAWLSAWERHDPGGPHVHLGRDCRRSAGPGARPGTGADAPLLQRARSRRRGRLSGNRQAGERALLRSGSDFTPSKRLTCSSCGIPHEATMNTALHHRRLFRHRPRSRPPLRRRRLRRRPRRAPGRRAAGRSPAS